jgi:hypothetical protein
MSLEFLKSWSWKVWKRSWILSQLLCTNPEFGHAATKFLCVNEVCVRLKHCVCVNEVCVRLKHCVCKWGVRQIEALCVDDFLFLFTVWVNMTFECLVLGIDHFMREILTLWLPLFFFCVKRLFCCIILVPGLSLGELPNLFVLDFLGQILISCILCCERNSCRSSILRHFRVYVTAGSYVTFLVKLRQTCHIPIFAFLKAFDFQSRKQNRVEFFVYKNCKLHI